MTDGRHLRVDGTYNLRDVGGYPTQAGGSVAWRTLFRSDSLQRLDSQGVAGLAALDLHTIVDLRADIEVEQAPSALAGLPARIVHAPMVRDPTVLPPMTDLGAEYRYTIDECGDSIGGPSGNCAPPAHFPRWCTALRARTGPAS